MGHVQSCHSRPLQVVENRNQESCETRNARSLLLVKNEIFRALIRRTLPFKERKLLVLNTYTKDV